MARDTVASGAVLDAVASAVERGELAPPPIRAGKVSLDHADPCGEADRVPAKGKRALVFRS